MDTKEAITLIQLQNGATIIKGRFVGGKSAISTPPKLTTRTYASILDQTVEDVDLSSFGSAKEYHFKNVLAIQLIAGDLVVVNVREGFLLLKVTDAAVMPTKVGCPLADLKHVVARVDLGPFTAVMEAEEKATHALALSEVTSKLQNFKDQIGGPNFNEVQMLLSPPKPASSSPQSAKSKPVDWDACPTASGIEGQ